MQIDQVPTRLSDGVDELRDRTASVVSPDTSAFAARAVSRATSELTGALAATEERLTDRVDARTHRLEARIDQLGLGKRTTMPRRLFWLGVGGAIGAAVAYLADPDRGRARRAKLSDQAAATARDVAEQARSQAQHAADVARGQVAETIADLAPAVAEADPHLLEQRVKSEVLGRRTDAGSVVLRIDGPGIVALKGTVSGPGAERELLTAVAEVDGVTDVRSELVTSAT